MNRFFTTACIIVLLSLKPCFSQNISLVKDITPSGYSFNDSGEDFLAHIGDVILFSNFNEDASKMELWRSDGTEAGTYVIAQSGSMNDRFQSFTSIDTDKLLFHLKTNILEDKIYTTDGTVEGTQQLSFIPEGGFNEVKYVNENIYYIELNDIHKASISDSKDEVLLETECHIQGYHFKDENTLYYVSEDCSTGSSTLTVKNITSLEEDALFDLGEWFSGDLFFNDVNGKVMFFFNNSDSLRLYTTDGTVQGSKKLGAFYGFGVQKEIRFVHNGKLYFDAYYHDESDIMVQTLWTSDGIITTPLHTVSKQVSDVNQALVYNGEVYFIGGDGLSYSLGIFKTDGTPNGTNSVINDPYFGVNSLEVFDNSLFFVAGKNDSDVGYEIYKSNGTESNIVLYETAPGADDLEPEGLYAAGNNLFLKASAPDTDRELYLFTPKTTSILSKSEGSFKCYPNPFSDNLIVQSISQQKVVSASLRDLSGKVVYEIIQSDVSELSLSNLSAGIYYLQLTSENATEVLKVVKK